MNILPYKLAATNDQITSRAGLLSIAQLMEALQFSERIDQHFPLPQSNRGFRPSVFVQTLILMQQEGNFHLDDVHRLQEDSALTTVLGLTDIPKAGSLGNWLRRLGSQPQSLLACREVNKAILSSALHQRKGITLDIDATEIVAQKSEAKWTYKKNKGYMPMVGHVAETGQVVSCDFRPGNTPPAFENLAFIQQCQQALPADCFIQALRIDAAGYQRNIIEYCDQHMIHYAIRATLNSAIKAQIDAIPETHWQPMIDKQGNEIKDQQTCRTTHCIGDYEKAFTLIIQRQVIKGQVALDFTTSSDAETLCSQGYIYRAIATNRDSWSDSRLIHWYNQRGEDSENRLKELKLDFGGGTLPCTNFQANALYFSLVALSYNLFALMRLLLPGSLANHRASTLRWRLYAMAGKVVKTARQVFVKLRPSHQTQLAEVLEALRRFEPPPI